MKVHCEEEIGQMSAICQLESFLMTFTWSIIESCWLLNGCIGPAFKAHEQTDMYIYFDISLEPKLIFISISS